MTGEDLPLPTWADAFGEPPEQWGLRGDPYVWAELEHRLAEAPVPAEREAARRQLDGCFFDVVGVDPRNDSLDESVHRPEFAHGGMSSGHVHLPTWRDRLLPLLLDRATGAVSP